MHSKLKIYFLRGKQVIASKVLLETCYDTKINIIYGISNCSKYVKTVYYTIYFLLQYYKVGFDVRVIILFPPYEYLSTGPENMMGVFCLEQSLCTFFLLFLCTHM